MVNAVFNGSFISYFPIFFIYYSWNFHDLRYHTFLFHPYHAHEVIAKAHEHALHPYPWNGRDKHMTAVEYCLDDRIRPFTP